MLEAVDAMTEPALSGLHSSLGCRVFFFFSPAEEMTRNPPLGRAWKGLIQQDTSDLLFSLTICPGLSAENPLPAVETQSWLQSTERNQEEVNLKMRNIVK